MNKLLITGSTGFIGSYFINKYNEKYDIKTFSFLKDDINSLDCSDVDVVFHLVNEVIIQNQSGIFLCADDEPLSTSRLIELIAKNLNKKIYLIKISFFESLLKRLKPSFHKRLYGSLEVDNSITKEKLNLKNPYSVEEGIKFMIKGELN